MKDIIIYYEGIRLRYCYDYYYSSYGWTDESLEKLLNHLDLTFYEAFKVLENNIPKH